MSDSNKGSDWAFPLGANEYAGHGPVHGMTLRDYFAAKAMQALVTPSDTVGEIPYVAQAAYKIADAMILERTKCRK